MLRRPLIVQYLGTTMAYSCKSPHSAERTFRVCARVVDIGGRTASPREIVVKDGRIAAMETTAERPVLYALPGFVDAHVHIESSMLVPSEFARLAAVHGTVATVSDPHEIANVLGVPGVEFMIANGKEAPFHFCFGAPSCVPATSFETAGADLDAEAVTRLLERPDIYYLSEVMNFPGAVTGDPRLLSMIAAAQRLGKPVDGHAPRLSGADLRTYAARGIRTDHECSTLEEALEKIACGMRILIREGSAARNFEALAPLLRTHPANVMLCSDDKHPDALVRGHINELAARAVAEGFDAYDVLRAACIAPVEHYRLPCGLLRTGDSADFVLVEDLDSFRVVECYNQGHLVARNGTSRLLTRPCAPLNNFIERHLTPHDLRLVAESETVRVIEAYDGQILTGSARETVPRSGEVLPDPERDLLKLVVVNRYREAPPSVALVRGFGIKDGALASSVAHDSHNVIAVGTTDEALCRVINRVFEMQGGVAALRGPEMRELALPVAGLMSANDGYEVARAYEAVDGLAKRAGSALGSPSMTLSFMALLVIPALKLSDRGLFDFSTFGFTTVAVR